MVRRLLSVVALTVAVLVGLAGPASAAEVFTTELQGEEEVPVRGDLDGSGFAVVVAVPEAGLVCYGIVVFGIAPATAAHIHEAPRGEPGPVRVGLDAPTRGRSSGCVANQEEAEDIAEDPANYYVNVHNQEYPQGAIRGQLMMAAATMPDTGVRDGYLGLLVGLAGGVLLVGVGLQHGRRRPASLRYVVRSVSRVRRA